MRATEFVESYFNAWNHRDPEAVAAHLTSDGIYRDVPENVQTSHDELTASLSDFFSNHQHRYELIGEIQTSRATIAFQYQIHPSEGVETGQAPNYCGAEFMTLHGDAAMTITDYYLIPSTARASNQARLTEPGQKYAKSGLSKEQLFEYKSRLEQIMQSQQVFLRSDLTLPKLAQAVDCSVNHLSQVINSGFGMSFFEYLNQHRIEYARDLLARPDEPNGAILNVAFTVGFNCNSAFYSAFKKRVGQSPAQYRREQLQKPR